MRRSIVFLTILFLAIQSEASEILIPMDQSQTNHLKAYGITYWVLAHGLKADWLLNYRGGSFAFPYDQIFENECVVRGVSYEIVPDVQYAQIVAQIEDPSQNEDVVKLEKAPKVAVYTPKNQEPWDDAVTLVLTYAEIPYDIVYDDEVLAGKLSAYDWLHLHHEDFTGQWGKFYASYANADWYQRDVATDQATAKKWGYQKVSQLKLAVAERIRDFVAGGGFLFAMCSGADTYDIALAAQNTDICPAQFDGDPVAPDCEQKLDYSQCFAFQNFQADLNAFEYKFSDIDDRKYMTVPMDQDYFTLFQFSAKYDPVPTMLTQDHTGTIKGFMGQTTAFNEKFVKSQVTIMGENKAYNEARYIHGDFGNGMWTFYGGHDPEDYQHLVGDPPTDLSLHPNSPGYRLILNNVLFPAAKKKKLKT